MRKAFIAITVSLLLVATFFIGRRAYYHFWVYPQKAAHNAAEREKLKERYYADSNTPNEILFVGNSLTQRFDTDRWFGKPNIKNRGIGLDKTTDILDRLDEIVESNPAMILLMIGINDLPSDQLDTIVTHYRDILQTIKTSSPTTQVVVQSILPIVADSDHPANKQVNILNPQLQVLAHEFDYRYLDIHSTIVNQPDFEKLYLNDKVHLNEQGYQLWVNILNDSIFTDQ